MDAASTLDAVRDWPVDDRLDLIFRLWDQLGEDGWQPEPVAAMPRLVDHLASSAAF